MITTLISAVPYVDQITFSAYLENERKEVELRKHGKEGAHDWSSHFKHVVNEVEHIAGDDAWHKREELLRNRITSIVPCDAISDNPLPIKQEPFEIISTSLCLEAACTSYAQYKKAVKKLIELLKPGGFFLTVSPERATYYMFEGRKWSCLYVTIKEMKEALAEAGATVIVAERDPASMEQIQNPVVSDSKAFVFMVAQRVEFYFLFLYEHIQVSCYIQLLCCKQAQYTCARVTEFNLILVGLLQLAIQLRTCMQRWIVRGLGVGI